MLDEINFPHNPPKGYHYETVQFKSNVVAIWTVYDGRFNYNSGDESRCIWGFYNTKTKCYHSPINSSKQGSAVDLKDTTPYSAMPINLSILERCFV